MNKSPLESLHEQFSVALQQHAYIGNNLEKTDQKTIRLKEVFKIARQKIEADFKNNQIPCSENQKVHLKELGADGKAYYDRYVASSHSWTRSFLKGLAHYTPAFLKRYLPSCFSNHLAEAEVETKNEYDEYNQTIQKCIGNLSRQINTSKLVSTSAASKKVNEKSDEDLNRVFQFNPSKGLDDAYKRIGHDAQLDSPMKPKPLSKQSPKATEDFFSLDVLDDEKLSQNEPKKEKTEKTPAQTNKPDEEILPVCPGPTKEEIEAAAQKARAALLLKIEALLIVLKQFDKQPLSIDRFKKILWEISRIAKHNEAKEALKTSGISEEEIQILVNPEFIGAFGTGDNAKIQALLQPTQWGASFAVAAAQKGHVTFGIKKFAGQSTIMLQNDQNVRMKESDFATYRGKVRVVLGGVNLLTDAKDLAEFLTANPNCRPCTIELKVKEAQTATPEFIQLLLKLSEHTLEICLTGVDEINFKGSAVTPEDEHRFVTQLNRIVFNGEIILSDQPKTGWTGSEFSELLSRRPTVEKLKLYASLCSSPKDIVVPGELREIQKLDLCGVSLDLIPDLLQQFPHLEEVILDGSLVNDGHLALWIVEGGLDNIKALHLNDCKNLTTDCLAALMTLQNLAVLSLPDLKAGLRPLNELPAFDNPFKINMFYVPSKLTQEIAVERYTGPTTWAPLFQIPLARKKVEVIFSSRTTTLDPKSVALWLYNDEYKALSPQNSVVNVMADSNAALNDDNIVEFMQKFPKAISLSLYNCPNVTSTGIIKLLKACPKVTALDLTGCAQVTEHLFFGGDDHTVLLGQLNRLILTNTGMTKDIVCTMQEDEHFKLKSREGLIIGNKIKFQEALSITDDDLTDEQALENLLKTKDLTKHRSVDLRGCKKLTNSMLRNLLERLNADLFVKNKEGAEIDNPQRLNLAVLNLSNCPEITEEAFHKQKTDDGKIEPLILGNLDRVIIDGTKIDKVLTKVYPHVTFQELDEPVTIDVDPTMQLQMCQQFYQIDDAATKKQLATSHVSNRIVVELFGSECTDKEAVNFVRSQALDTSEEQYCDFTLSFKTNESAPLICYPVHRDVLCNRSLYFVNNFRPGGLLSRLPGVVYTNLHATEKATKAIVDLFYGRLKVDELDWKTAADVAELAGPHIFDLPKSHLRRLLDRVHSQFDVNRAEEMLTRSRRLDDKEGIDQYEATLVAFLESLGDINDSNRDAFRSLANIAKNHNLKKLKELTDKIEVRLTVQLQKSYIAEQNAENERIMREMVKTDALRHIK